MATIPHYCVFLWKQRFLSVETILMTFRVDMFVFKKTTWSLQSQGVQENFVFKVFFVLFIGVQTVYLEELFVLSVVLYFFFLSR